jgi:hypothetical protein
MGIAVSIFEKNCFDFVCIFLSLEFVLMKKAPVNGVFNQQFTHFTLYLCLLALRQMASKTEFKAGSMMVRYDFVSWLEYASISNMWAMMLMHENKIKLLGGTIIPEVIECFVTAVFEVGIFRLRAGHFDCHFYHFDLFRSIPIFLVYFGHCMYDLFRFISIPTSESPKHFDRAPAISIVSSRHRKNGA